MTIATVTLRAPETDHELLWSAVGAVTLGLGWLTARTLPGAVPLPSCLFKVVTGWPCLTCGGTRAALAFAHGDLLESCRWNPLVAAALLGWCLFLVYGAGALIGLWPRLRVRDVRPGEAAWLRTGAVATVAATWLYLVIDAR